MHEIKKKKNLGLPTAFSKDIEVLFDPDKCHYMAVKKRENCK